MSESIAQIATRIELKSKEVIGISEAIVKNLDTLLTKKTEKSILWNSGHKIKHQLAYTE